MYALKFRAPLPLPNRADRSVLPAFLTLILLALMAFQFFIPPADEAQIIPGRAVIPVAKDLPVKLVRADPVIVDKPIFTPVRADAAAEDAGPFDGAKFAGVVRGRGFARAVMQLADGEAKSVNVGGAFLGWRLVRLTDEEATFSREGIEYVAQIGGVSKPSISSAARSGARSYGTDRDDFDDFDDDYETLRDFEQ